MCFRVMRSFFGTSPTGLELLIKRLLPVVSPQVDGADLDAQTLRRCGAESTASAKQLRKLFNLCSQNMGWRREDIISGELRPPPVRSTDRAELDQPPDLDRPRRA
jgi:hypothetical protein